MKNEFWFLNFINDFLYFLIFNRFLHTFSFLFINLWIYFFFRFAFTFTWFVIFFFSSSKFYNPWILKYLSSGQAFLSVWFQYTFNYTFKFFCDVFSILRILRLRCGNLSLEISFKLRCERKFTCNKNKQNNSKSPNIRALCIVSTRWPFYEIRAHKLRSTTSASKFLACSTSTGEAKINKFYLVWVVD